MIFRDGFTPLALATIVLRQELYLVDCKSLPVNRPNRPVNSSKRENVSIRFSC